jgi:predicted nucleotidyltransferase
VVPRTKDCLTQTILGRISAVGRAAQSYLDEASEVIVFGSMAVGLDRPDSDIDVMCIGGPESKLKTNLLDLIVFPRAAVGGPVWLQSELALHVRHYGVWIKGTPDWIDRAQIGQPAIGEKRRRVEAFMRHLPDSWSRLDESFRVKYSIKVRREAQRSLLLSRRVPVPPTRMLDTSWDDFSASQHELHELLRRLAHQGGSGFSRQFLSYVDANLHSSHV